MEPKTLKIVMRPNSPLTTIYAELRFGELQGHCPVFLCSSVEPGLPGFLSICMTKTGCPDHLVQMPASEILLISADPDIEQSPIGFLRAR